MKKIILCIVMLGIASFAKTSFAAEKQQYMQIYHQQQLEKARYKAAHNLNDSRKDLADIVGGKGSNTRIIEFNYGHEMTDEEYEEFQRQNRW